MLLLARDEDGEPMTDAELRDELLTLLVAGHETTATGLAWAFELLLRNPPVLERLQASLREGDELPRRHRSRRSLRLRAGDLRRRARGARGALRGRRLVDPARDRDQPVDRRHPSPGRLLPGAARVPARALPRRRRAGHLHVAPVRRRHAALPGRELRDVRDAGRDRPGARARGARRARPAERAVRKGVTFVPNRGARVVQPAAPVPVAERAAGNAGASRAGGDHRLSRWAAARRRDEGDPGSGRASRESS